MSTDHDPFRFDDALEQALKQDPVPALPAGFADRVVAATQGRADPLPQTRTSPAKRWRSGRRLVVGAVAAGALASAAAATGLLEELPIELPSAEEVWSTITGQEAQNEPAASAPSAAAPNSEAQLIPDSEAPVTIEGPIDTPEELEEAFRRIDERRGLRRDTRREAVDQRIDNAIDRRREQGLRAPTPQQEERLRGRIERFRDRTDERRETRIEERREELREEIENGGAISREDFIGRERRQGSDTPVADRLERLRELPPEERRARIRQWRERREERRLQRLERRNGQQSDSPSEANDPPETAPGSDTENGAGLVPL